MIAALYSDASFLRDIGQHMKEAGDIITRVTKDLEEEPVDSQQDSSPQPWIHWGRWQIPVFAIFCELSRTFLNYLSVDPNSVAVGLAGATGFAGAFISIWYHAALSPVSWVVLLLTAAVAIPAAIVAIGVTVQKTSMLLDEQIQALYIQKANTIRNAAERANIPAEIPLNRLQWLYRLHQSATIGAYFLRLTDRQRDAIIEGNRGLFNLESEYLSCKIKRVARKFKHWKLSIAPEHHAKLSMLLRPKVTLEQFKKEAAKLYTR